MSAYGIHLQNHSQEKTLQMDITGLDTLAEFIHFQQASCFCCVDFEIRLRLRLKTHALADYNIR